jgi:ABC-type multidrug transport system fused ATPase/permease subunit
LKRASWLGRWTNAPKLRLVTEVFWKASHSLTLVWWLLIMVRGAVPALSAFSLGWLTECVSPVRSGEGAALTGPLIAVAVVFALGQAAGPIHTHVSALLGAKIADYLARNVMSATLAPHGLAHVEDDELASVLSTARNIDAGITGPKISDSIGHIATGFTVLIGGYASTVILFGLQWWIPLVLTVAWTVARRLLIIESAWAGGDSDELTWASRVSEYAFRLITGRFAAKEVRVFGMAGWLVAEYHRAIKAIADAEIRAAAVPARRFVLAIAILATGNAGTLIYALTGLRAAEISTAELVAFATALVGSAGAASPIASWWLSYAAGPMPAIFAAMKDLKSHRNIAVHGYSDRKAPQRDIVLDNVSFRYDNDADHDSLHAITMTIPAGSSIAIVGKNGAGKSTLVKLLCRFYEPASGEIRIDGVALSDWDPNAWQSQIAAVFQDFARLRYPLRDNVIPAQSAVGAVDDTGIRDALSSAGFPDDISLDAMLSPLYRGGRDLSGGQWQRIALARVMFAIRRGARLVVLDEPTAQLDVRGETEVFGQLLDATRDITTILISHRFSTVRRVDTIYVIDDGRIVETGSHEDLMRRCGTYARMFQLQAATYRDAGEPHGAR